MFLGIINILLGAVIVSPAFLSKDIWNKYEHLFRWIGIALLVWGGLSVVGAIFNIFLLFTDTFYWLLWIIGGLICLSLGAMERRDILNQFLTPKLKVIEEWIDNLLPQKKNLGIAVIIIGFIQLFL